MANAAFDTLKFANTLKASGMDDKQTEALVREPSEQFTKLFEGNIATRTDIVEVKAEIVEVKAEIGEVKADIVRLDSKIDSVKESLENRMEKLFYRGMVSNMVFTATVASLLFIAIRTLGVPTLTG